MFRSESRLYRAFQTGRVGLLEGRPRYATFISSHEQPLLAVHEERVTCGQSPTRLSWFSLVRSADEPGIVSHEDGAEIRAQGWHDCNYDHKPGFAELSWSECAEHVCQVSEMRNIAVNKHKLCAESHCSEAHRWRRCSGLCLMVVRRDAPFHARKPSAVLERYHVDGVRALITPEVLDSWWSQDFWRISGNFSLRRTTISCSFFFCCITGCDSKVPWRQGFLD